MQGLPGEDFSFKNPFLPFTSSKAIIALIIVGFIVFGNMLFNSFIYDDNGQIITNPLVHSLSNIHYFFQGGSFYDPGSGHIYGIYYRPMLSTIFTLIYSLFGQQAFAFHLFQLLLHICNSILLFLFFRKFFRNTNSFFLSIIFLVHPINQETVAYISDLQDVLFFFFGMLGLLAVTSPVKSEFKILQLNMFLFISFLSKETGLLFAPILLFVGSLFQRKTTSKLYYGSILVVTLLYLYIRFFGVHITKVVQALSPIMKESLIERTLSMPAIFFYYLKTLVFPDQLALDQLWTVTQANFPQFYLPLIVDITFLLALSLLGIYVFKKNKKMFSLYLFFFVWFLLGMTAHLQIIPLEVTVADRFFYFPFAGLLGLIGVASMSFTSQKKVEQQVIVGFVLIILVLLAGRTIVRNTNFANSLTLCTHDLQIIPNTFSLQTACAEEYFKAGNYEEAKKHYAITGHLAPNWAPNWYEYGLSYEYTGDVQKARAYYRKSIQLSKQQHVSSDASAYVSLAASYMKQDNQPQKAKEIVEEGLHVFPHYQLLQLYLAVCEYRLHNQETALKIATEAYQASPTPQAQYVLNQIAKNQNVKLQ
jgi:tetratricopeptide (TPR) repeat protein